MSWKITYFSASVQSKILAMPVGFVAPLLGWGFPVTMTPPVERGWQAFVSVQARISDWGPVAYGAVVRPTGQEAVAWETLLVIALLPWLTKRRISGGSIP